MSLSLDPYRLLIRPLLFRLPAETAQHAAEVALRRGRAWRALSPAFKVQDRRLSVSLAGLDLDNCIGIAAGFDKDCRVLPSLASLGFGYLVCGTVTEAPRPGNPKPRLLRLAKEESLVNSMGFPSRGLDHAARRLEMTRHRVGVAKVAISISGTSPDEIVRCHRMLAPLADAVELNISSPNTAGLRVFHEPLALRALLGRLNDMRSTPLMVKLPPYSGPDGAGARSEGEKDGVMSLVRVCVETGVEALTVANSRPVLDPGLAAGTGGLSGRAIFPAMLELVSDVHSEAGGRLDINACGGIFSGEDAWKALKAGATTVQIYTSLAYRGPAVVRYMKREMLAAMARDGADSLTSDAL